MMNKTSIAEPARSTPVLGEYDVVVLGGGPSGIAAAVAAANHGATVLLIERYGFLGGMGTAAGVTNFCGLHANVSGEIKQVVFGVAASLLDRIRYHGGLNEPHVVFGRIAAQAYDTAAYKIAADELLAASKVRVLFHALACGVLFKDSATLGYLLVETKSGRCAIGGQRFIDCSGDGDLACWAGIGFELGDGQGNMLYPSTMFRINAVDPQRAGKAWETMGANMAAAQAQGRYQFPRKTPIIRPQKNPIEWRVNLTQLANANGDAINGIDAAELSEAEQQGRQQIASVMRFLREVQGFENSYLVDIAAQVGIRETRRLKGEAQLTEDDVLECRNFDDSIGVNGWPLELHKKGDVEFRWPYGSSNRGYNQLPYGMLVNSQVHNLWFAGRCASMTHEAQSAARVSGACFVMGEAAGTAAALLSAGNAAHTMPIADLQSALTKAGVFLG
jgi:FAD dependent oxidoreductase